MEPVDIGLGGTLNDDRILHVLGRGGMGDVYVAEDTKLKRRVALKVLPRSFARDPERAKRFKREAQVVAVLNHPNIVTIHCVETAGDVAFLTMELVDGAPVMSDNSAPATATATPRGGSS